MIVLKNFLAFFTMSACSRVSMFSIRSLRWPSERYFSESLRRSRNRCRSSFFASASTRVSLSIRANTSTRRLETSGCRMTLGEEREFDLC